MERRFKYNAIPSTEVTDSHMVYLQVQLSGGFWDSIKECKEKDYILEDWDDEIAERLEKGFRVRINSIVIIRRTLITEMLEEIKV